MKNRLLELDALRGIAALSVVLFHLTTRYDELYGHPQHLPFYFPWGKYGVHQFFVISGFVIFMTLEKIKDLFVLDRLSILTNRVLVFLGTISYCLYLIHSNIGYVTIRYLYSMHAHPWLIILIPLALSIGVATLMTFAVEQPMLKLIRRKYQHYKDRFPQDVRESKGNLETV